MPGELCAQPAHEHPLPARAARHLRVAAAHLPHRREKGRKERQVHLLGFLRGHRPGNGPGHLRVHFRGPYAAGMVVFPTGGHPYPGCHRPSDDPLQGEFHDSARGEGHRRHYPGERSGQGIPPVQGHLVLRLNPPRGNSVPGPGIHSAVHQALHGRVQFRRPVPPAL